MFAQCIEHSGELGHEKDNEHGDDGKAHHAEEGGISDRARDAFFHVFLGFGELSDAGEGFFEKAALAARPDHAYGHVVEDPGEAVHGVGQGRAFFDLVVHFVQDVIQTGVRSLFLDYFQRPQQRDAAVEQVGQLREGGGDQLAGDAADFFWFYRLDILTDFHGKQGARDQSRGGFAPPRGLNYSGYFLAGVVTCYVLEVGHD